MTTVNEIKGQIGKEKLLVAAFMNVRVRILDAREVWGKVQYQITPVAGSGTKWVDEGSLRSVEENPIREAVAFSIAAGV
jgi:hypothetical protein